MKKSFYIKNHQDETVLFKKRLLIITVMMGLLLIGLVLRLLYLQIYEHQRYTTLAKDNSVRLLPIEPNRGLIFDRHGVLLAENLPVFELDLIPDHVPHLSATIQSLQQMIAISHDEIKQFYKLLKQSRSFMTVPLKVDLTPDQLAKFYVNQYRYPGVIVNVRMQRHYPFATTAAAVVGYVGQRTLQDYHQSDASQYLPSSYIGKIGIEHSYERYLRGRLGYQEVEINASGRIVKVTKRIPPVPGENIYLTIDFQLQQMIEKELSTDHGAVVVIEPASGAILALVSTPSYDSNVFLKDDNKAELKELLNSPDRPLYNRSIRGQYAFGSTSKPFLALAALDQRIITTQFHILDPGYFKLPHSSHVYHDWKKGGHGWVNVSSAIMESCDTFFYQLSQMLGIRRIDNVLQNFGFGAPTGIDIPGELNGLVASPEWKLEKQGKHWYPGDTINASIGQGYMLATPLQLAAAASMMANRGIRYRPYLVLRRQTPNQTQIVSQSQSNAVLELDNPSTWDIVIQAMQEVINNPRGTGYHFGRNPPYTIAAKTGTAQVYRPSIYEEMDDNKRPQKYRNNDFFIAFAPVDKPQIAVAVVVEHAQKSAALARKIIDYYLQ